MKIIVAIKQVPECDAQVRIDPAGKWIEESDLQYALNEPDAYALEEALQLREKHGGEVIVLSAGPERVGSTLREALASALKLETLARQYILSLQIGPPVLLSAGEMAVVRERYRSYGR